MGSPSTATPGSASSASAGALAPERARAAAPAPERARAAAPAPERARVAALAPEYARAAAPQGFRRSLRPGTLRRGSDGEELTTDGTLGAVAGTREVPRLDAVVELPAGCYVVGEPGEERAVRLDRVLIGRWPVVNAHLLDWARAVGRAPGAKLRDPQLADHPATGLTRGDVEAFCAWASLTLGRRVRLPRGDEWEALARGDDRRPWPWGDVFDAERCACAESGWGWTVPVGAHPAGAGPFGAEQLAGNAWEWVSDRGADGWGVVRGGSYLDTGWGLRASRVQPADPARATTTTGFRIAIDPDDGRSA